MQDPMSHQPPPKPAESRLGADRAMHDQSVPRWQEVDGVLQRTLQFADFAEALAFVVRVGALAEYQQHHPDIDIRWNKVTVRLTTHDAGSRVTERDRHMAVTIDGWLAQ